MRERKREEGSSTRRTRLYIALPSSRAHLFEECACAHTNKSLCSRLLLLLLLRLHLCHRDRRTARFYVLYVRLCVRLPREFTYADEDARASYIYTLRVSLEHLFSERGRMMQRRLYFCCCCYTHGDARLPIMGEKAITLRGWIFRFTVIIVI